jgi:Kef-type K+ transport system membrane component KefB
MAFLAVAGVTLVFFKRIVGQRENSHTRRIAIETLNSSAQFAVRLSVLVLIGLVYLAARFDLDVLLGAFAGGFIIGQIGDVTSTPDSHKVMEWMKTKLEAIGFGVFIPAFFVMTGADFQLETLLNSTRALFIVPLTALAFLAVRGVPVLLGYKDFDMKMRWRLALVASTQLPLVATLMERFIEGGQVPEDIATAVIGGCVLSVAIFPLIAFTGMEKTGKRVNGNGEEEKVIESLPEIAITTNGK